MFSIRFPQDYLFRTAGHSVDSSVTLNKIDCSLHINKHLTYLDYKISNESIVEQCIETVHLMICGTQRVQFL